MGYIFTQHTEQVDINSAAISVTTAAELLGGSKFLLGFFFPWILFPISLETIFQKGMVVMM